MELITGERNYQQIRLTVKNLNAKMYFSNPALIFQNIPLNIPRVQMAHLKNGSVIPQAFTVMDHELSQYIDVYPKEGVVYPNSSTIIFVTVKFTSCVAFDATVKFNLIRLGILQLPIKGNIVYPDIVVLPRAMNFKKISCSTMDTINFTVENRSVAVATVTFDMAMYPEFRITETDHRFDNSAVDTIVLQQQGMKHLCIRFTPFASTKDKFALPMIVNDILGTAEMGDQSKSKVVEFLTNDIPGCKMIPAPSSMHAVDVQAFATKAKLFVSKLLINLSYTISGEDSNSHYNLVFTNCQPEFDEICIRTDALIPPLYLKYAGGKDVVVHEKSITCRLDPDEEVRFDVSFCPERVGRYRAAVPVYLRSEKSRKPHTCINIEGLFPEPIIKSLDAVVHFKPLPLKVVAVGKRRFLLENHFENCKVSCSSGQKELELEIMDRVSIKKNIQQVTITSHFRSERCQRAHLTVHVYCSCGANCDVSYYLIAENCFLTNYALVHTYIMNPAYNLELRKHTSDITTAEVRSSLYCYD